MNAHLTNNTTLIARDLAHVWHPCSQMKDFESSPPIIVERAIGSYIYTNHGPLIDATSSWWCKSLGHGHPAVIHAIQQQLQRFEHVIAANTTHPILVELAETLAELTGKQHTLFASDGACAVEMALKLSLQAQQLKGHPKRHQFIALQNGYHGETLGALAVTDLSLFKQPFKDICQPCVMLNPIPYVTDRSDPLWDDCSALWPAILQQLEAHQSTTCAIILEPVIQGSAGMRLYSADFLRRVAQFAKARGIYLIADEIMTGLCRTGQWFACEHAAIEPDMICLSKGLTSGTLPLSCVVVDSELYHLFYGDSSQNAFIHSHTFSGHALAASAALATLRFMQAEGINQQANQLGLLMQGAMSEIARQTGQLNNIRQLGAIIAAELSPHTEHSRIGFRLYQEALRRGALLRPLGNTLYWLPPLTTNEQTIGQLAEITLNSIEAVYN